MIPHRSGDNDCPICCDRPCDRRADCSGQHEFCSVCIQQWRAQTVMKAQQGTTCPHWIKSHQNIAEVVELVDTLS